MQRDDVFVPGTDTVRGIAYQQAQAVLEAIGVLETSEVSAIRVEGRDDVVDLEAMAIDGAVLWARQYKTRSDEYTWGRAELLEVLDRWADLPAAEGATFEFVTDGRLGPTGEVVRQALADAESGSSDALAMLISETPPGERCRRLAGASIRTDRAPVGALLQRAERRLAQLLPQARSEVDLRAEAQRGVDTLFRLLVERAGNSDASARTVDRREIASAIGVPEDWTRAERWPGHWRPGYLSNAAQLPIGDSVDPMLSVDVEDVLQLLASNPPVEERVDLETLLSARSPVLLAGTTGTGKTTSCRLVVAHAARTGQVAVHAGAEGYLSGRLALLVADSMSVVADAPIPVPVGRAVLEDSAVLILIDGVSEIPDSERRALAEDLRVHLSSPLAARVVLVGRDLALLRATLPPGASPSVFKIAPFDHEARREMARRVLSAESVGGIGRSSTDTHMLASQVEHALGGAASNPLLFRLGLALVRAGLPFTSRATMYQRFVELIAARTGTTEISALTRVLGLVFSALLDRGKRYADGYEWRRLLIDAIDSMDTGLVAEEADGALRRSGLVVPIGYSQQMAPVHDSFADFLSALALASGEVELPEELTASDEQRLLFSAEMGSINDRLVRRVARDLPFQLVGMAQFDQRGLDEGAPAEIAAVLRELLPDSAGLATRMWREGSRAHAWMAEGGASGWVAGAVGRDAVRTRHVVLGVTSPLDAIVRLWRQALNVRIGTPSRGLEPIAHTAEEASAVLSRHATESAEALELLTARIFTSEQIDRLAAFLELPGIVAQIQPLDHDDRGRAFWPVRYRRSETVDVRVSLDSASDREPEWSQGTLEYLVSDSPSKIAARRVREAVDRAVGRRWL